MSFWNLSFGVYHLGIYLAAALVWLFLCLFFGFNARRLFPRFGSLGLWTPPLLAVLISAGLLWLDALARFNRSGMALVLVIVGFALPLLGLWKIYLRLRTTR